MRQKQQDVPIRLLVLLQTGLTLIALVLLLIFQQRGLADIFLEGRIISLQLIYGLLASALMIIPVVFYARLWPEELEKSLKLLLPICREPLIVLALISLLAGLGEELLFRAFLQELLGIWPASILFMLAHAGFWASKPHTRSRLLFAPFSLLAALLLGVLYSRVGLISAIAAHSLYDYFAFWFIKESF